MLCWHLSQNHPAAQDLKLSVVVQATCCSLLVITAAESEALSRSLTSYFSPGLKFSLDFQDTGVLMQQLCLPCYDTAPSQEALLSQQQLLLVRYQHKVQKMLQMKISQTLRIILPAVKASAGSSEVQYKNSNYFFSKYRTPALHFLLRLSQHLIVHGFKFQPSYRLSINFPTLLIGKQTQK